MGDADGVLLQRFVTAGDGGAFAEIVRRHAGMVYGVCYRLLADADRACDATQETFLQLIRHAGQMTGSVPAWLHRVATGKAVDVIRADTYRKQKEARYVDPNQLKSATWQELSVHVDEALDELDEQTRGILIAHFFEHRAMTDIAAEHGISRPTVSRKVEAGVARLRAILRNRGVLVAAAGLGEFLAESPAQAMPAVLLQQLAKIALVAQAGELAGASGVPSGVHLAITGALATVKTKVIVVGAVAIMIGGALFVSSRSSRPGETSATVAPTDVSPEGEPRSGRVSSPPAPPRAGGDAEVADQPSAAPAATEQREAVETGNREGMPVRPEASQEPEEAAMDLSSPESTVTSFARFLEAGDMEKVAACFVEGAEDLEQLRVIMSGTQPKYEEMRQVLSSVGLPIEKITAIEDAQGLHVSWLYTVKKAFTIRGEGGMAQSYEEGDKFGGIDATLQKVGDKWLISGI